MKKRSWFTVCAIILLWIIAGELVDNSIKLPSFFDVILYMKDLLFDFKFYEAFAYTLIRSMFGLVFALIMAIVFGLLSGLNQRFSEYFEPIYIILKSIPNVSYILIVLIWTNSAFATCVISFMVMFPMAYANVYSGIKNIEQVYLDELRLNETNLLYAVFHVYLPLIQNYIFASLSNGIGLTFKVGIMAEILGSVSPGLGRQFQLCRINVDMVGVFAWTAWLIIFLICFESLVRFFKNSN